jgi:hypothetical protein
MYRVDAHGARDDLFGIGKGEAQVVDLSPLRDAAEKEAQRNFVANQQKEKLAQGREEDVYTQLKGLNKVAIMDRDRPLFAKKQADIYDYVKKNINALRNGDTNKLIEFQNNIGNLYTEAELSKNTREKAEQTGSTILSKGLDNFYPEDIDRYHKFISGGDKGEFVGNYDVTNIIPHERVNFMDVVHKTLAPNAQHAAQQTEYGAYYPLKNTEQDVELELANNPAALRTAERDFSNAKNKLGATNAVDYYKKLYAPLFTVNDRKALPEYYLNGGSKEKEPKVSGTFVKKSDDGSGTFQFEYTNTSDNPYITIRDPKDPNKSLNIKPISVDVNHKQPTTMQASVQLTEAQRKANQEAIDNGESAPYKEIIDLDYKHVDNILKNKFKIPNVFDIAKGKPVKGVDVKYTDISKSPGSKSTTLSSIKSKVGTKGFEGYTEKELVDYYKSQGYEIK